MWHNSALNAAWKNQQLFTRGENEGVSEEFIIREKEVQFIPQKRIKSLLEEVGFINIHKFFKAYLFGGYVAIKDNQALNIDRWKSSVAS